MASSGWSQLLFSTLISFEYKCSDSRCDCDCHRVKSGHFPPPRSFCHLLSLQHEGLRKKSFKCFTTRALDPISSEKCVRYGPHWFIAFVAKWPCSGGHGRPVFSFSLGLKTNKQTKRETSYSHLGEMLVNPPCGRHTSLSFTLITVRQVSALIV